MIDFFESSVRLYPDSEFFSFVDDEGLEYTYSYWQGRLLAASFARKLQSLGMRAGEAIAIDLPNCPEFVFVALAAAYGGFPMVLIDNALSESDKLTCLLEAERAGLKISCKIDEVLANNVFACVRDLPSDDSDIVLEVFEGSRRSRSIMGESQDLIDDTVHFAERAAHLFDKDSLAAILYTGGRDKKEHVKHEKLKAVPLLWSQILDAASISNEYLSTGASRLWQERLPFNSFSHSDSSKTRTENLDFIWQCVLPFTTIGGLQSMIRSIVARTPFILYTGNNPDHVLHDAGLGRATHIAVDDAVLQDLLTIEEWRDEAIPGVSSRLSKYQCLLLVGKIRSARTMKRAYEQGTRIFASFGSPETSGIIATSLITPDYQGGITPIDAYEIRIIDPDEEGFGRLAVQGPGVFDGYLNSRTPFTVDHFFITEEKAALVGGKIYIRNRRENMFVSAGQSIFPVEIADVLRHVPGVAGVHVFGVNDARAGKLPVAVIERSDPTLSPQRVKEITHSWLSSITVPINIFVFDQLPRTEHGKLDRNAIETIFATAV